MENVSFRDINRLNRKQLQDLLDVDDGGDLLEEFFLIFEKTYREKMPKIKDSADRQDWQTLCKEMHSFKVSCHNIGAARASAIAKEIHRLASQSSASVEILNPLIQQLEDELETALIEIKDFMMRRSG